MALVTLYLAVVFIWLVVAFARMGESNPNIFIPIACGFFWPVVLPIALIIYSALGVAWVLKKAGEGIRRLYKNNHEMM